MVDSEYKTILYAMGSFVLIIAALFVVCLYPGKPERLFAGSGGEIYRFESDGCGFRTKSYGNRGGRECRGVSVYSGREICRSGFFGQ